MLPQKRHAGAQVESHTKWLKDVVAHCEDRVTIDFPIIGDADRSIAVKYGSAAIALLP